MASGSGLFWLKVLFFNICQCQIALKRMAVRTHDEGSETVSCSKRKCFPDGRKHSPTIICFSLSDDSNPSLSKDISSALCMVPECFDSEGGFPLEDELHIEPLSLDGLSMLSDPDMVLPDPSVEDTFRSDRL